MGKGLWFLKREIIGICFTIWTETYTESASSAGDLGSIPRSGWSPREGNGYSLQYSCLENSMDRGAWRAIVHVVTKVGHNREINTFSYKIKINVSIFWICWEKVYLQWMYLIYKKQQLLWLYVEVLDFNIFSLNDLK